jgi:hypothetical protein
VTGYLDRLLRRAQGEPTGLRPREPAVFEPTALLPETETFEVDVGGRMSDPPPLAVPTGAPRADPPRTTGVGVDRPGAPSARMLASSPAAAAMAVNAPSPPRADGTAPVPRPQPPQPVTRGTDAAPSPFLRSPVPPPGQAVAEQAPATSTAQADRAVPASLLKRAAAPALAPAHPAAPTHRGRPPTRALRELSQRRPAAAAPPDTVIEVRIGRVEVAPAPAVPPRPASRVKVQRPPVELSDYLKQRRSSR